MNKSRRITILTALLLAVAGVCGAPGINVRACVADPVRKLAQATESQSTQTQAAESQSTQTQATESQSTQTQVAESQSTQAQAAESESAQTQGAAIKSSETQASETKSAASEGFSEYELGCMAQYYYKRTDAKGFYPPEVKSQKQEDGAYLITLFETKKLRDQDPVVTTYAVYRVNSGGKGVDTTSGKEIDLTLYSKVYTPQELCRLAQNHYYTVNDFYPPQASYTANKDGTYTIRLYETIDDEDGTEHTATCGWYTVNVCGVGTDDLMQQPIDINR